MPEFENPSAATPVAEIGPTITATFKDGPLKGSSIEAEIVEGRPPKTIDAPADDPPTTPPRARTSWKAFSVLVPA